MKNYLTLLLSLVFFGGYGQDYFPTNSGVKTQEQHYTALINATIHPSPNQKIDQGTVLFRNQKIVTVGENVVLPKNTIVVDAKGKHIYASFIELLHDFGIKKSSKASPGRRSTQYETTREGYYWNDHILSDYNSISDYAYDKAAAKKMRAFGFGTVNTHRKEGIHRGTAVLVSLNDHDNDAVRLIDTQNAQHLSFKKSSLSSQYYPGSIMGSMALLRQVFHDADWYAKGGASNKDLSLEAVLENKKLPTLFETTNKLDVIRAGKIGNEFQKKFIISASGREYEHLNEIKTLKQALLVPLNFPKAYDVSDPVSTQKISLNDLRYWNQAPSNPSVLAKAGVQFAFTSQGVKSANDFLNNIRKAIRYGLNETQALAALTTQPAKLIGKSNLLGALKKGAYANFIVTDGPLFQEGTQLLDNWVQGKKHTVKTLPAYNLDGKYTLQVGSEAYSLEVKNSEKKISATVKQDSSVFKSNLSYKNDWLTLKILKEDRFASLNARIVSDKKINGDGTDFDGNKIRWEAQLEEKTAPKKKKDSSKENAPLMPVTFPNNGFGFERLPSAQNVVFKNATVWTNEAEGILTNTDVWVQNGKIKAIGKDLVVEGAESIEATGKHLTSGIIDEHSHIGASSINEGGHNSSAEVTIEDVIDADDIDLYRNLSGGVTTLQILHGSANPIGGRSAIIKPRWGKSAEELLYQGAAPFIKFALGENVKQSNWPSYQRFPQTRMGVEQVFVDYFQRATEYKKQWETYNALSRKEKAKSNAPRYDLEMETLVEILDGKRFISCHSYVQSEINMLMKVAERFGVTINTFTHILEGYKVADKMKEHGVGGSTFSDWWAYKFEVNDAIPYNGAIMHSQGVTVAFNSDDAEMSRRLNQEAAKAVKYGGISEEDAWKFVTLNPAKLLHIDDKVGSVKVGKSADLVLWSDHPMSIYAIAEKTMIEGVVYYDYERATAQVEKIAEERNQIIKQMIDAKNGGAATQKPKAKKNIEFHCETLD